MSEKIEIFPAFKDYLTSARFKVAYGGRGSGKTRTFVTLLVSNCLYHGWRIVCFREIMKSIDDSIYQEISEEISRRGLDQHFDLLKTEIRCLTSGGVFKFDGLYRNQQKIKGYSNFDCAFVEEAANVTADSWKMLIPTLRKNGSEIWVCFNPESPLDDTYKRFVTESPYPEYKDGRRYMVCKKINYTENPRFPQELQDDMEIMKEDDYTLYLHVYEGMPVANSDLAIIRPEWIEAMEDIHLFLGIDETGETVNGFDVADEGDDANAHVVAKGQVITAAWEWKDNDPNSAAVSVWNRVVGDDELFGKIVYDNIGVGAGAKGELRQRVTEHQMKGKKAPEIEGFNAAASVVDPDQKYDDDKKNKDMFANLKAQAWWRFREGAYNAWKARAGKDFDADKVISISSAMDQKARNKLKAELSQPRREYVGGKVKVESKDKMKKRGVKSPNLADAAIMCFAPRDTGNAVMVSGGRRRRR